MRLNAVERPRPLRPLGSGVASPDLECVRVRIKMQGLNAGDHAQFTESWDVVRRDGLDMLNARAHVAGVIRLTGILVRIERGSHRLIADRVSEDLQAALVQFG